MLLFFLAAGFFVVLVFLLCGDPVLFLSEVVAGTARLAGVTFRLFWSGTDRLAVFLARSAASSLAILTDKTGHSFIMTIDN